MTQKEFIEKAILVHGNKYSYEHVEYVNSSTKVVITCKIHGNFLQVPNSHLRGHNCKKCTDATNYTIDKRKQSFLQKATTKFPDLDFSVITWVDLSTPIQVTCKTHGVFTITPHALLHQNCKGCPKCNEDYKAKVRAEDFKITDSAVHGDIYDYSLIDKIDNLHSTVPIKCALHGVFNQCARNHLNGSKCHICTNIERGYRQRYNRYGTPATLYLVYFKEYDLYKIGVTVDLSTRFNGEPYKPVILYTKQYLHEAQAYHVETQLFRKFYKFLYKGPSVLNRKGNTELLTSDVSDIFIPSVETIESSIEYITLCEQVE